MSRVKQLVESNRRGVFYITRRCDLRCWYCAVPRINASKKDELDIDGIRQVIQMFRNYGVDLITIFGGEPMLRYDVVEQMLPDILEFAYPVINTNGKLIVTSDEHRNSYKRMVDAGLNNMSVSVDSITTSPEGDGSDIKSYYAWGALDYAKQLGVTDLSLNAVIDTANPVAILPVLDEAKRYGYDVRISIVQTPNTTGANDTFGYGSTSINEQMMIDTLTEILFKLDYWNIKTTGDYFKGFLYGLSDTFQCSKAGYIVVTPDGRFQLCQSIYGEDLLTLPLDTDWDTYENVWKKDLKKHCPKCYLNCHVDYHQRQGIWSMK